MTRIAVVHGIGQTNREPVLLQQEFGEALKSCLLEAGRADLACRIHTPNPSARLARDSNLISVDLAYYADVFTTPNTQGAADPFIGLTSEQRDLAEELSMLWLYELAEDPAHSANAQAQRELSALTGAGREQQGIGKRAARTAVSSLSRVRWLATSGLWLTQRLFFRDLVEVVRYMTDEEIREQVSGRLVAVCDSDTKVLIAHSLGSVVAYDYLCRQEDSMPVPSLLITLGSPLGLRSVIYDRLSKRPPAFPEFVPRWVNVSDKNDLVATKSDISQLFPDVHGFGRSIESLVVNNGRRSHDAFRYLAHKSVGELVSSVL
ncbi:hypothetical protein [Nakamurella deserti]|uniref:hypothetical protein n=1 Tax=Nakamurella deserti TaxID=2164074 RepID=UPI0013001947|nr:hypothetical protein [Nakamurella deserti]